MKAFAYEEIRGDSVLKSRVSFATVLTLIVVPVLFAIFFRVPSPSRTA